MTAGQNQPALFAEQLLDSQHWPEAALYVVATPIGNLADISPRALRALSMADAIACEDTRTSRALLQAYHIDRPLLAAHKHNEAQASQKLIDRLQKGERIALVSDAGSPAVSDPGARIVRAVQEAGLRVVPIPGSSAVISLLMACGFTQDDNPAFSFGGFLPTRAKERTSWMEKWLRAQHTVVFFESPHRIAQTAKLLAKELDENRQVAVGRELTKQFEEVAVMPANELPSWLADSEHRSKGEFVLAISPASEQADADQEQAYRLIKTLMAHGLSVRDCSKIAAKTFVVSRDDAYQYALSLKEAD